MNKAIIVAAGKGSRFGSELPKQFCCLAGRPLIMTTIDRMASAIGHENIILVIDENYRDIWEQLCLKYGVISPRVVYGGTTRQQSVLNALNAIPEQDDITVMIHDGARPAATVNFLKRMSELPQECDGMIPAVKVSDTLRLLSADKSQTVDRSRYVSVQTPQTFRLSTLLKAYSQADYTRLTDDASVVESAGFTRIILADGEPTNIKVTNPLDLAIAETIIRSQG